MYACSSSEFWLLQAAKKCGYQVNYVSIQQLIQAYVDATKGHIVSCIPYPPAKVF
jgi:glutathione peroxidase-family protein